MVVTGVGITSALGLDESEVWAKLVAGETGVGSIGAFDTSGYRVAIGAEADSDALRERLAALGRRPIDRAPRSRVGSRRRRPRAGEPAGRDAAA